MIDYDDGTTRLQSFLLRNPCTSIFQPDTTATTRDINVYSDFDHDAPRACDRFEIIFRSRRLSWRVYKVIFFFFVGIPGVYEEFVGFFLKRGRVLRP